MALKLIEKDVHEKQDQLISLRKQLDEIKSVNLKLQDELKVKSCLTCVCLSVCVNVFVCERIYVYSKIIKIIHLHAYAESQAL